MITDESRAEILKQVGRGEPVADVAKAYNISENTIYGWIHAERQKALKAREQQTPVPTAPSTQSSNNYIEQQMDQLVKNFAAQLKELLKKQILDSIRGL